MKRNIELKATCAQLGFAQRVTERLGAELRGVERQRDTYFHVASGRLKLRQRWLCDLDSGAQTRELPSQLIRYHRADQSEARASDYQIVTVDDAERLREVLDDVLGVVTEVAKLRRVYLFENVRIHLDEVEGLGTFLEFEAIVDRSGDEVAARGRIEHLRAAFEIVPEDVVAVSYANLRGRATRC